MTVEGQPEEKSSNYSLLIYTDKDDKLFSCG